MQNLRYTVGDIDSADHEKVATIVTWESAPILSIGECKFGSRAAVPETLQPVEVMLPAVLAHGVSRRIRLATARILAKVAGALGPWPLLHNSTLA